MAASATFALKAGVWFRRGRLLIVSPDSLGTACPLSGRNSTYRPVQILEAGSSAAIWARRTLPAKNTLSEADARQVKDAFRNRLAELTDRQGEPEALASS